MAISIYVGNLPWSATEDQLRALFEQHGNVSSVKLMTDRETGRARGFGFVEMEEGDARQAIAALNGKEMDGRSIRVNQAEEKREKRDSAPRRW